MSRKNFILYNVLNQEVIFQEYFCNLLNEKSFMKKFLDFIEQKNEILKNEIVEHHHFSTEYPLEFKAKSFGRADIFLKLDTKNIIFEVKNKVYTSLTENQPRNYLNYLKRTVKNTDFNTCLMFLIPRDYAHKEVIYQEWGNYSKEEIDQQLFYWEDFVLTLKDEENVFVKAFYEFCLYWFELNPIHLTKKEIALLNFKGNSMKLIGDETLPTLLSKLELAVVNIGRTMQWEQYRADKGGYTFGYNWTKKIKSYQLFMGMDYDLWKEFKQPINIYISQAKDSSQEFEKPKIDTLEFVTYKLKGDSNADDFFAYVVKLDFKIDEEHYEEKIKDVMRKITQHLK
ncbi:PD-(D/E)XK nuclease family protein [Sulfurospirillum sp. MES]|uniref:PD-(D/E)XK nuclease family protein n=1 Tax=Sulfurospirillum sp. MES TaxID=1565314 RepID=UPI0005420AFF|nr:PD-(D/E)XK nuclease family protein [Sulfurospirillum sp. MES]KHG33892.1 MAG: hypothetical protein OA34_05955 [Sulfurospirillum sp. MES]